MSNTILLLQTEHSKSLDEQERVLIALANRLQMPVTDKFQGDAFSAVNIVVELGSASFLVCESSHQGEKYLRDLDDLLLLAKYGADVVVLTGSGPIFLDEYTVGFMKNLMFHHSESISYYQDRYHRLFQVLAGTHSLDTTPLD